jgi:hypothetical protein
LSLLFEPGLDHAGEAKPAFLRDHGGQLLFREA